MTGGSYPGRKDDKQKDRWDLLPWDGAGQIVKVLNLGAERYGARNWEHGILYSRCFAALMRHLTAWWNREDMDPETSLNHLAHAASELLFLLTYEVREMENFDDRP